jgi:AcrR family transcriptional regulator
MIDTKQRILDTAERLFGQQGYGGTSLRQVIAEAEVNVAAVHYHFGCKEDLLDAVVMRNARPLTEVRLSRLNCAEAEVGAGPLEVEKVLECFLLPAAEMAQHNPAFVRFMGRMLSDGMMPALVEKHFHETAVRFITALGRALPHLRQDELKCRFYFMIGAMAHTMGGSLLQFVQQEVEFPALTRRLITFLAAGFRAPSEGGQGQGESQRSCQ